MNPNESDEFLVEGLDEEDGLIVEEDSDFQVVNADMSEEELMSLIDAEEY